MVFRTVRNATGGSSSRIHARASAMNFWTARACERPSWHRGTLRAMRPVPSGALGGSRSARESGGSMKTRYLLRLVCVAALFLSVPLGCRPTGGDLISGTGGAPSGGATGTGGAAASGGTTDTRGAGGRRSEGGTTGTTGTGGARASGGASGSGGVTGSGGSSIPSSRDGGQPDGNRTSPDSNVMRDAAVIPDTGTIRRDSGAADLRDSSANRLDSATAKRDAGSSTTDLRNGPG